VRGKGGEKGRDKKQDAESGSLVRDRGKKGKRAWRKILGKHTRVRGVGCGEKEDRRA